MTTTRDRKFFESIRFDVVEPEIYSLANLPCFLPVPNGGYHWNIPDLGDSGLNISIGFEMGLAYLRLKLIPEGYESPNQVDPAPSDLENINDSMMAYWDDAEAFNWQRAGFMNCIGLFLEHALNAPHTLPELRRRILSLDDATLRRRCLAILDGVNSPNIFAPEGMGWPE